MSTKISSGLVLTQSYFLRNYYSSNTDASKSTYRKTYSNLELNYEDSRALRHASKRLSSYSYDGERENQDSIANAIGAYCDTFNNTLTSAKSSSSTKRYATQLKNLAKTYEEDLSSLGITVEKDGSLTASTNLVSSADLDKLKEIFGDQSEFSSKSASIAKKLNSASYDAIFANLTGTGTKINIVL